MESPFKAQFNGVGFSNPEDTVYFGQDRIERTLTYFNDSYHDISVIDGIGMTLDIPAARTAACRLVIKVSYKWGERVRFNPSAMLRHCPGITPELIGKLEASIRNGHTTAPRELDLYYVIDLDGIEQDPFGLWLQALNIQVVSTYYVNKTIFYNNDCFFNKDEEAYDREELIWASTLTLTYIVHDHDVIEPLFVPFGNDVLEVKPVFRLDEPLGLHLNVRGQVGLAAGKSKVKSMHVKPDQYREYGIYSSKREWKDDLIARSKGYGKDEQQARLDLFTRFHKLGNEPENFTPPPTSLRDVVIFDNYTIGHVFDFVMELAKVETAVEKLFKTKK